MGISIINANISDLVSWASSGDLRLPEIQRRYIWTATRVRDYIDSLYRGYPTGTILLWDVTNEEIETKNLSLSNQDSPKFISVKRLLLDGQQRITSLTALIMGKPLYVRNKQKPLDILFNLDHPEGPPIEVLEVDEKYDSENDLNNEELSQLNISEELEKMTFVVRGSSTLEGNPKWISVMDIFQKKDTEILKSIGISSENEKWDKYSERIQKVRNIKNYSYQIQALPSDMSYQEVTQVFVRVNSKGMKLRGHDLAVAQISAKWKGFVNIIENFAEEFKGEDDYLIDTGIIVRGLVVFTTKQCKFDKISRVPLKTLKESFERCKKGLRYAINFVSNNASVGTLDNISSPYLLIPIAVYSILKDQKISKEEEKKLLKWFYNAHMKGHYAWGSSESLLDVDLGSLFKYHSLDKLLEILKKHVKAFTIEVSDITYKNKGSPFFTMFYFALTQTNIKDWETGLIISNKNVGKYQLNQHDHIFPKSMLKKENYDSKEINEIANIAFLTNIANSRKGKRSPTDYFNNEVIPKWGKAALESQLIPLDPSLWELKNYKFFLEYRRKAIVEFINNFMKRFEIEEENKNQLEKFIPKIQDDTPYGMLKNLENNLRLVIENELSSKSNNWWMGRIPNDVRENAEIKKQKNEKTWPWYTGKSDSLTTYLDFNDYLKIIRRGDNWKEIFKNIFIDEEWISAKFKELSPIRNSIAHNRELNKQDIDRLKINATDIISCINRKHNNYLK